MRRLHRSDLIKYESRSKIVQILTALFALMYHTAFLITFYLLKVPEMVYFNIGSVVLFSIVTIIQFKNPSQKVLMVCFLFSFLEVILHQCLSVYFIGIESSFQFLIIIIGILPFLVFNHKIYRSVILSFLATLSCILLFAFSNSFPGVYTINSTVLAIIKIINITLSFSVIIFLVMIFTEIVFSDETHLKNEIEKNKIELNLKTEKVINIQNNTIIKLANLVENRDTDTGLHVRRSSAYVKLIAEKCKTKGLYKDIIDDDYIEYIYRAAPLHDVGKIVISDLILKKPGKLTGSEFDAMKKHTVEGKKIIEQILFDDDDKKYLQVATEIACSHHERWDGTGYPHKLHGKAIPLSARIMAIADVYDALITTRCYKEAISPEEAFKIIEEGKGTHFDPVLTQVFLEMKEEIISLEV